MSKKDNKVPIENCGKCNRKTLKNEWLSGLINDGLSSVLTDLVRYNCPECGHQMYSGLLVCDFYSVCPNWEIKSPKKKKIFKARLEIVKSK